jgi:hypothetical protein
MDISLCLDSLVPAAQYRGVPGTTEEEYNALRWEDSREKPTWSALIAAWPEVDLSHYKESKFRELNSKIQSKFMFIKKIKKLDTVRDDFIDEYKKSHASKEAVDASIAAIETDLFEV